jgi:peroxiredoxin
MVEVGQKAPNFKLIDKDKNTVTLDNYKGKNLIIFFFPAAWTGTCTKEICSVQEDFNQYSKLNTQVIGVSTDTHWALKRFAEDYKIEYPLLSDFNKVAIKDYGVEFPDLFAGVYHGVAKRATIVIDETGVIRFVDVVPNIGDVPNMDVIKDALTQLA